MKRRESGCTKRDAKLIDRYDELAHAGIAPPVDVFLQHVPRPSRRLRETLQVIAVLSFVKNGTFPGGALYIQDDSKAH